MMIHTPYPSLPLSAHVMDQDRLGIQMTDSLALLREMARPDRRRVLQLQPVYYAWLGYERGLISFLDMMILEWERRGHENLIPPPSEKGGCRHWGLPERWMKDPLVYPQWLGYERLHASHRAALLKMDPMWYVQFCWNEPPLIDYHWPGRLPDCGEYLVRDGIVSLVMEQLDDGSYDCMDEGGAHRRVTRMEVLTHEWTRARLHGVPMHRAD